MTRSNLPSLWERLKHDVTFRVATVYAGGSWFIVEALDTLQAPTHVVRGTALILAALFLPVVGSVALWQRRTIAERAAVTAHLIRPRPGLRRWAVAVLSLVLIAGGMWAFGSRVRGAVPEAAERIAVLPFHGTGSESVREIATGMVDLLTAALSDVGPIRTIPSRTVLARVGRDGSVLSIEEARAAARAVGAGSVLTGSITSFDDQANLVAELRDVTTGHVIATAEVRGSQADMMSLTDRLAVALVRELWRSRTPIPAIRTAALTTDVPAALRSWLRGEQHLRDTQFDSAAHYFEAAVAADSTFALAWSRLAEVVGWSEGENVTARQRELMDRAVELSSRLPERERSLVRAYSMRLNGSFAAFDSLKAYVRNYPDDPIGWYHLGDARFHAQYLGLFEDNEVIEPFLEATRLDPTFGLGVAHVIDIALAGGDRQLFDETLPLYARFGDPARVRTWERLARVRWAPPDSLLHVFGAELRTLRMPAEAARARRLAGVVGSRVRTDMNLDPVLFEHAADTLAAVFAGDRDFRQLSFVLRRQLYASMARIADWHGVMDEQIRLDGGNPAFGPELTRALEHISLAGLQIVPASMVAEDVRLVQAESVRHPLLRLQSVALRAFVGQLDPSDPAIDSVRVGALPPGTRAVDTLALSAAMRGLIRIAAGDTVRGLPQLESGLEALGYIDAHYTGAPWQLVGSVLARRPGRERQGVLMMREHIRTNPVGTSVVYLDLARALERLGERTEARDAYAHALRFLRNGDAEYSGERLREIEAALVRLSREP